MFQIKEIEIVKISQLMRLFATRYCYLLFLLVENMEVIRPHETELSIY